MSLRIRIGLVLSTALLLPLTGCGESETGAEGGADGVSGSNNTSAQSTITGQSTNQKKQSQQQRQSKKSKFAHANKQTHGVNSTASTRQFLSEKLSALKSFKSDPKFHQFGFGTGGEYHSWLEAVKSKRDAEDLSILESEDLGHLEGLGLEYVSTRGSENDYTRWATKQINKVINRRGQQNAIQSIRDVSEAAKLISGLRAIRRNLVKLSEREFDKEIESITLKAMRSRLRKADKAIDRYAEQTKLYKSTREAVDALKKAVVAGAFTEDTKRRFDSSINIASETLQSSRRRINR